MKIKQKLYRIIFEADTIPGKLFDIILLILILYSITIVVLESVPDFGKKYKTFFYLSEWIITYAFTVEYLLRIYTSKNTAKYLISFYGVIDFLSIMPAYLSIFVIGAQSLMVIRALRLLRVFRILKITRYTKEGRLLINSLIASRIKISVFLFAVLTIVLIVGTMMYLIEGESSGFVSIPRSIYWTIVTLTTVGYGDITPHTAFGQFLSAIIMILGYAIIAVPTGIVTIEMNQQIKKARTGKKCNSCKYDMNDEDALYCKKCGSKL